MAAHDREMSRRVLLRGAALTGVAAPVLAACGSDGDGGAGTSDGNGSSGPKATVASSDVPVGGGTVLEAEEVVVTQPAEGEYKAFSAICTHQGCPVQEIADGTINCPCHGSKFSVEDGSVVSGPADKPLPSLEVAVEGDQIEVS